MTQAMGALDLEWEKFQQTVLNPPDERETYDRATVFAEPELASETPEGFPLPQPVDVTIEAPNKKDEEQARRQKEQDERELIIDRLLDEERAQEEADMKVSVMKGRLEALKKKRASAKALKSTK
jgi:zinc finger protein 830